MGEFREAERQKVRLLCFPESYLQGYLLDADDARAAALDLGSREFAGILEAFPASDMAVVMGMIERECDKLYNTAIMMAHALGLITQHQFEDLGLLRKVRNEFTHTWDQISLSDQRIRYHIQALHFHSLDDVFPQEPRLKLKTTIGLLLIQLRVTGKPLLSGKNGRQ